MKISVWLRQALNGIRSLIIQIVGAPGKLWRWAYTRITALLRGNRPAEPPAVETTIEERPPARWQRIGAAIRRGLSLAGQGFVEIWQLLQPAFVRLLRRGRSQTGLLIRKIGVKRRYRYNLDPNPLHQLLADLANALAIVIGLGAWPYQRAWFAATLPPLLAPHYWVLGGLLSLLPLLIFYLRWQSRRQQRTAATWDLLTISTGLVGLFVALFAGLLMFSAFTAMPVAAAALICAIVAIAAWLVGEGANAYAILIRRPRPFLALLNLSKSLLFMLSGWLILLYLLVVNLLAASIQLESAGFLYTTFCTTGLLGALLALAGVGWRRFGGKLPRLVAIAN